MCIILHYSTAINIHMNHNTITIEAVIHAPIEKVWQYWTAPEHVTQWCHASDDWEAPYAESELKVGGAFMTRMSAKDGSEGFDFTGTYTAVTSNELIEYEITGGRRVTIQFISIAEGVKVIETFEMEDENSEELQRAGWQAILDNFKKHAELS